MQADTLELCDLVDMPGISDPNMAADTWDEVLTRNDHVVWCTHATQAWRQSEAALWEHLRGATSGSNLLLITQFDKLRSPRDQSRVLARVQKGDRRAVLGGLPDLADRGFGRGRGFRRLAELRRT